MKKQTRVPLAQFIQDNAINMVALQAPGNPNMADAMQGATHYRCNFTMGGAELSCYFSMGPAYTKPPKAGEVLDCLASDAAGVENARDFADWCSEYGYDEDSRKAEKIYNTCRDQAQALKVFLGADLYQTLLFDTERE